VALKQFLTSLVPFILTLFIPRAELAARHDVQRFVPRWFTRRWGTKSPTCLSMANRYCVTANWRGSTSGKWWCARSRRRTALPRGRGVTNLNAVRGAQAVS